MSAAPLHLAIALDGAGWHPAAWREPGARPRDLFTPGYWTDLVAEAENGKIDFVAIEDSLGLQAEPLAEPDERTDRVRGRLDAVLVAARVAPATRHIGLVPTATVTHTEPFHISKAIATLDYVSTGRAGLRVQVSARPSEAAHFGRRRIPAVRPADLETPEVRALVTDLFDEAADYVEVVRRLWDSWEDDAEIRDAATGRFIDRAKLHYIDFKGERFSVKGPSITPRPPQGQPLVTALAHSTIPYRLGARAADVVYVTPHDGDQAAAILGEVRAEQLAAGQIYDLDVVGRPDTFTVLAALAAVTDRLGLAGTINSTFNEPYEVARQFASLDHLSQGRAAWNVVTSWDAFTGENFRRGGFLAEQDRYSRATQFLQTAGEPFDSRPDDAIVADQARGVYIEDGRVGAFAHHDGHFDIAGRFNVPRSPQGRPVILQAGDSEAGREFAAATADAIFSRHGTLEAGQAFHADVKRRLAAYGRGRDELLVLPAATFVLGDSDDDAQEKARVIATSINDLVQRDAADGFILVPHVTPDGLDEFAGTVVPLLQEWGVFRADYTGPTLRDHLGLAVPRRRATAPRAA